MDTIMIEFSIEVFPMMQTGAGYWWAVHNLRGHILKLGRADTEAGAFEAADAWVAAARAQAGEAS